MVRYFLKHSDWLLKFVIQSGCLKILAYHKIYAENLYRIGPCIGLVFERE